MGKNGKVIDTKENVMNTKGKVSDLRMMVEESRLKVRGKNTLYPSSQQDEMEIIKNITLDRGIKNSKTYRGSESKWMNRIDKISKNGNGNNNGPVNHFGESPLLKVEGTTKKQEPVVDSLQTPKNMYTGHASEDNFNRMTSMNYSETLGSKQHINLASTNTATSAVENVTDIKTSLIGRAEEAFAKHGGGFMKKNGDWSSNRCNRSRCNEGWSIL